MSSLHQRVYGGRKDGGSTMRLLGSYNKSPQKLLEHTNGVIKRMGVYNGTNTGKGNMHQEVYPRY